MPAAACPGAAMATCAPPPPPVCRPGGSGGARAPGMGPSARRGGSLGGRGGGRRAEGRREGVAGWGPYHKFLVSPRPGGHTRPTLGPSLRCSSGKCPTAVGGVAERWREWWREVGVAVAAPADRLNRWEKKKTRFDGEAPHPLQPAVSRGSRGATVWVVGRERGGGGGGGGGGGPRRGGVRARGASRRRRGGRGPRPGPGGGRGGRARAGLQGSTPPC